MAKVLDVMDKVSGSDTLNEVPTPPEMNKVKIEPVRETVMVSGSGAK
jgi:hypothetical protein